MTAQTVEINDDILVHFNEKLMAVINECLSELQQLKKSLGGLSSNPDIADNGEIGLELFKKYSPDLVITDIIMPEKEGLEIIREMKKLKPELKIIAISGGGRISADNYLNTAKSFGADRAFQKPFKQSVIVGAVRELLG